MRGSFNGLNLDLIGALVGTSFCTVHDFSHSTVLVGQVKATNGDTSLGGEDFDHAILTHLVEALLRWFGIKILGLNTENGTNHGQNMAKTLSKSFKSSTFGCRQEFKKSQGIVGVPRKMLIDGFMAQRLKTCAMGCCPSRKRPEDRGFCMFL